MGTTTIRISERNRDRLQDLGKMGETYDMVLDRILDGVVTPPCKLCEVHRKEILSIKDQE